MAIFLATILLSSIVTYSLSVTDGLKKSFRRQLFRRGGTVIFCLLFIAFAILLVFHLDVGHYGFYYSYEIYGPYYPRFIWVFQAVLVELLAGLAVGFLVGRWLYNLKLRLKRPRLDKAFRRHDVFVLCFTALIVLAIHPSDPLGTMISQIKSVSLSEWSVEFSPVGQRQYAGQDLISPYNNHESPTGSASETTYLRLLLLRGANHFEEAGKHYLLSENFLEIYRSDEIQPSSASSERSRLLNDYLLPLARCATLTDQTQFATFSRFFLQARFALLPRLVSPRHDPAFHEKREEQFLDAYMKSVFSVLQTLSMIIQDPYVREAAAESCLWLVCFVHTAPDENDSPDKCVERNHNELENGVRSFLRRLQYDRGELDKALSKFTDQHAAAIRTGLQHFLPDPEIAVQATSGSNAPPWGVMLLAILSSSSRDNYDLMMLEHWINNFGNAAHPYHRIALLQLYDSMLTQKENVNPILEIDRREQLIQTLETVLLKDSVHRSSKWYEDKDKSYCRYNDLAKYYFQSYIHILNQQAFRIAVTGSRIHDYSRRPGGLFGLIERARDYSTIITSETINCVFHDDNHAKQFEPAFIDTALAVALTEFQHSELSQADARRKWRERFIHLRDRAQRTYSWYSNEVHLKTRSMREDGTPFTSTYEHPDTRRVEQLEERLHTVATIIETLR